MLIKTLAWLFTPPKNAQARAKKDTQTVLFLLIGLLLLCAAL